MVNIEHHHRRIRAKAKAVHYFLMPLALAVPALWLYFALDACQDAESPRVMAACRVLTVTPLLPAALGILACAWIVRDLIALGKAKHAESGGAPRHHLAHALHGYRTIDHHHRRHFHFAAAQAVVVAVALAAWLAVLAYRTTR